MTPGRIGSRRGVLLYFALFGVLILGLFAVHFHRVASHAQRMSYRLIQAEGWHLLAEAAMEEAFQRVAEETANPDSPLSQKIRALTSAPFPLELPLVARECRERYVGRAELSARCRVVDARSSDSKGRKFHPGELCGTLELTVTVDTGKRRGEPIPGFSLVRHHDFRIVSMVSAPENRKGYANNFILDYLVFARFGLEDFRRSRGALLNGPPENHVRIFPESPLDGKRGLVFFGGTEQAGGPSTAGSPEDTPKDNFVFVNTDESTAEIIPPPAAQEIRRVGVNECCLLIPELNQYKSHLSGLEGVFHVRHVPLNRASYAGDILTRELEARNVLLTAFQGAEANISPPRFLLPPAQAGELLRGAYRQRFLSYVDFRFDASKISNVPASAKQTIENPQNWVACLPRTPAMQSVLASNQKANQFYTALWQIAGSETDSPILSKIISVYPMKTNPHTTPPEPVFQPLPRFFRRDGGTVDNLWGDDSGENGFHVYRHGGLYAVKAGTVKNLEKLGIIDLPAGVLRLRGVISVDEPLLLANPNGSPLTIIGQGVLVAPSITLGSGINKGSSTSLCVLYANQGPIEVNTDQEINASLLSFSGNHQGRINVRKPLKMRGCLAADHLEFDRWTPAPAPGHLLYYDPMLRTTSDLYQINVSRWVTFQRLLVKEGTGSGSTGSS